MDLVTIDGKKYDVLVTNITETYNILYSEETGRTIADGAPMTLTPIGTFFSHSITFYRKFGNEQEYDRLYDYLSRPRTEGIAVKIAHNQTTLDYEAYVSTGERSLIASNSTLNRWGEFTAIFTPMKAQVLPDE